MNETEAKAGIRPGSAAKAFFWSWFEAAAAYPFIVLLAVYGLKSSAVIPLAVLWLFHFAASLLGVRQARGRNSSLAAALLFAACAAVAYVGYGLSPKALLILIAALLACIRGLITGRKQLWSRRGHVLPLIGIAASLIVYAAAGRAALLQEYRLSLYVACIAVLFTLLLNGNAGRVRAASQAGEDQSFPMARILTANRKLTWGMLAVIVLLTAWQGLGPILAWLKHKVAALLQGHGSAQQEAPPEQPAQPPAQPFAPPAHQASTPEWLKIIGDIFIAAVLLAVAVLLCIGIYRLIRRWLPAAVRSWVTRILARLKLLRAIRTEQAGYVDEVERLEQSVPRPRRVRIRRRKQGGAAAGSQEPRAAYEALIRLAIKKGFRYRSSRTPAENGEIIKGKTAAYTELSSDAVRDLIDQYESARYGR